MQQILIEVNPSSSLSWAWPSSGPACFYVCLEFGAGNGDFIILPPLPQSHHRVHRFICRWWKNLQIKTTKSADFESQNLARTKASTKNSKGNFGTWPNTSFLVQITLVFIQFGPKPDQIQTTFFWIFTFFSSSKLKLKDLSINVKEFF